MRRLSVVAAAVMATATAAAAAAVAAALAAAVAVVVEEVAAVVNGGGAGVTAHFGAQMKFARDGAVAGRLLGVYEPAGRRCHVA